MTGLSRLPTFFVPHGGGPCFFIKPEDMPPGMPKDLWRPLERWLRGIAGLVGRRPKAVLVISAHWMTARPTVGCATSHHLLYDYYNFPDYTYRFNYAPPGSPEVATRIVGALHHAGIDAELDATRGIDHGVFIPLMLVYPEGDVPIVPMSLQQGLAADDHIAIGKALAPLRDEDILIIGSGMSFHNMRAMKDGSYMAEATAFDDWLGGAATAEPGLRNSALTGWSGAPGAMAAHPPGGEEHLIPLMVAAGAAGPDTGRRTFGENLGNRPLSGFMFG